MNQSAARLAWYRFRATFRHRWSGYLTLAVLIGLVGGVAMGSVAAARRTYSSYPTFLASTNPSDLIVVPQTNGYSPDLRAQLARLPLVRNAEGTDQFNAVTLTPRGGIGTVLITQVELVASPDGLFSDQDRVTIVRGRAANPARSNEVVATTEAAAVLGLHVGSRLPVGIDENGAGKITPFHRKLDLTVVGLGELNIQIIHDDIDTNRTGFLLGTPALAREYGSCCAVNSYDGLQLTGGSRDDAVVEQEYDHFLNTSPYTRQSGGQLVVYITSAVEAEAQRAIRPEAIALAVFGAIAGLAALIIGTQSISRQIRAGADDTRVLRALGAGPAATMADGLLGILGAVIAGALLAAAVAIGLSPLTLFGPVRTVDPAPGIDHDWTVLGLGAVVLVLVLGGLAVASVRRRRRDFALLKTLGFTRRQLSGAVAWQSSVIVVIGLVVGVPVGIAAGRWLWLAFARELSAVPDPSVPVGSIALAGLGALLLANVVAALPGRHAARTSAAEVLRAE